ncbi:MAG: signal recognition particle-docking protein FtsY [bacterium]|jgi:fused signal recognition particle receptor|nr:signal recognition particle-docking protein FtsY [Planctomycetota bacterium]HIL51958.1 signal recognition particle-docking protein FtsY [Planctomycetota bacterium]
MGLLDRLRQRLTRTRSILSDGISAIFRGGRKIDASLLDELEELLYTSDLGPAATPIVAELARLHKRGDINGEEDVRDTLREILLSKLDQTPSEFDFSSTPMVILIVGVNGSGKTTTIAKLCQRFADQGKSVIVGAADTFRAAAADQLEVWAERTGADIVRSHKDGADPAAIAFDTVEAAVSRGKDVAIIDTAGRLHTQKNLMAELEKIRRVVGRRVANAPQETWLVIDATNGQNAISQAREFTSSVEVTGLLIAKLDGTARGGALFGIKEALGLPVRFVGTGESVELLEEFEPGAFVDAILGRIE